MANTTAITLYIPPETFEKKQKALYELKKENSNFSKKMAEIIEEYAKRFDEGE